MAPKHQDQAMNPINTSRSGKGTAATLLGADDRHTSGPAPYLLPSALLGLLRHFGRPSSGRDVTSARSVSNIYRKPSCRLPTGCSGGGYRLPAYRLDGSCRQSNAPHNNNNTAAILARTSERAGALRAGLRPDGGLTEAKGQRYDDIGGDELPVGRSIGSSSHSDSFRISSRQCRSDIRRNNITGSICDSSRCTCPTSDGHSGQAVNTSGSGSGSRIKVRNGRRTGANIFVRSSSTASDRAAKPEGSSVTSQSPGVAVMEDVFRKRSSSMPELPPSILKTRTRTRPNSTTSPRDEHLTGGTGAGSGCSKRASFRDKVDVYCYPTSRDSQTPSYVTEKSKAAGGSGTTGGATGNKGSETNGERAEPFQNLIHCIESGITHTEDSQGRAVRRLHMKLAIDDSCVRDKTAVKALSGGKAVIVHLYPRRQQAQQSTDGQTPHLEGRMPLPLQIDPYSVKARVHRDGILTISANIPHVPLKNSDHDEERVSA